jgi:predicted phage terminase large subunit-like protein
VSDDDWIDLLAAEIDEQFGETQEWDTPADLAVAMDSSFVVRDHLRYLSDRLTQAVKDVEGGQSRYIAVSMPPRLGKQVADREKVLTTKGWKRHGDLRAGDYVFAPDGNPVKVLGVSEPSNEKVRVTFTDGSEVTVHPNHEWTVYDRTRGAWRTVETRYLMGRVLWPRGRRGERGSRALFQLPPVAPLQAPDKDLPVDPYTLGVWLGDGGKGKGVFCGTEADVDAILRHVPYERGARHVHAQTGVHYQTLTGGFRKALRAAGVFEDKHVPETYLTASESQRRALLAGIVDTDGHVGKDCRVAVSTSSLRLAEDVRLLVRTLGYRAGLYLNPADTRDRTLNGHKIKGGEYWTVSWTPHDGEPQGRALERKTHTKAAVKRRVAIASIEPAPDEPGRCIQVEGGLYLVTEGLVPTHNSHLTSIHFPLWVLHKHPAWELMLLSHDPSLAAGWGRAIRRGVENHGQMLNLEIAKDAGAAKEWEVHRPNAEDNGVDSNGSVLSRSIRESVTGRGAKCITGDTVVESEYGRLSAAAAYERGVTRLLAFDHESNRAVWQTVEASQRSRRSDIVEVRTAGGRVLRCTSDHPVFTSRGYVPAADLQPGRDSLVAQVGTAGVLLREPVSAGAVHRPQEDQSGVPIPALLTPVPQPDTTQDSLCGVRNITGAEVEHEDLWHASVSRGAVQEQEGFSAVQDLWRRVAARASTILLAGTRGRSAFSVDAHRRETPVLDVVPSTAPVDPRARWVPLCGLRDRGFRGKWPNAAGRPSHQRGQERRQAGESNLALPGLSRPTSRVEEDTVSSVEWIGGGEEWVYDFQVAGTHNFFAGEILTHNCMILDDIVKDFADAHSTSSREFIWDWWTANSRTRLHPPALVVVIGTRWHEDDIIGRLLSHEHEGDPEQWEVISFPALAPNPEATNPVTKKPFGPDLLGRKEGEPLLSPIVDETPEQALERWADIRQAVGSYAWASLFMQSPEPSDGAIFNSNWWQFWRPGDLSEVSFDRYLTSWDMAFKKTDQSDYVVGQLWGAAGANRYLLKQVRKRMTFTETLIEVEQFVEMCKELVPDGVHEHIVEDKANGTAVLDVLKDKIPGMIPFSPGQDSKEARARAISPTVEAGNVYLPALADWLPDFLSEHKSFPNGAHDDQVDCATQALLRLRSAGSVVTLLPQGTINRAAYRPGGMSGMQVGRRRV